MEGTCHDSHGWRFFPSWVATLEDNKRFHMQPRKHKGGEDVEGVLSEYGSMRTLTTSQMFNSNTPVSWTKRQREWREAESLSVCSDH